jgi:hypothetical protein
MHNFLSMTSLDLTENTELELNFERYSDLGPLLKRIKQSLKESSNEISQKSIHEFRINLSVVSSPSKSLKVAFDAQKFEAIEPIKLVFDLDETLINAAPIGFNRRLYVVRSGLTFLVDYLQKSCFTHSFILSNANQLHVDAVHSKIQQIGSTFIRENIKGKGLTDAQKSISDLKLGEFKSNSLIIDDTYKNWFGSANVSGSHDDCFIYSKRFMSRIYMAKFIDRIRPYTMYGFQFKDKYNELVYEFCECRRTHSTSDSTDILECFCQGAPQLPYLMTLFQFIEDKYMSKKNKYPLFTYKWNVGGLIAKQRSKVLSGNKFILLINNKEIFAITKLIVEKLGGLVDSKKNLDSILIVDIFDEESLIGSKEYNCEKTLKLSIKFVYDAFFNFYGDLENPKYAIPD